MLKSSYSKCILVILLSLLFVSFVNSDQAPKGDRQAIPLAIVQADALAGAKHPPNADKANSTCNGTSTGGRCNQTAQNNPITVPGSTEDSLNQNAVNMYNGSLDTSPTEAAWHLPEVSHQSVESGSENQASNFSKCKQIASVDNADFDIDEFTRCNHSQEILVGPLKKLPDHPNGNGPQDMKLKETGGYRRTSDLVDGKYSPSKTITRVKRLFDEDAGDGQDLTLVLDRRSNIHIGKHRAKKKSNILKRANIGMPYVPIRSQFGAASRIPYDDSQVMDEEMSNIPSSQPVGLAGGQDYEPTNYEPVRETERSMLFPGRHEETDGPDPIQLQEAYERSSSWEPIGNRNRFDEQQEYNYGLPDHNYDRTLESEANTMDNRLVNSVFGHGKRTEEFLNNPPEKSESSSILDSLGIGQADIDQKYLSEARNIQAYLTRYQGQETRSLGHDSRQQNNIQLDTSPELLREHPDAWNMIDSASYTPYSQEADSLLSSHHPDYSQILQSQKSMGRVFVPYNLDAMSNDVQREISKNYATAKPNGLVDPERALQHYPKILKSFYPNVPYQTVTGASLHPPDLNLPGYRSFIQQGYPQPFMPIPYARMPMALPFNGFVTNSNTQMQYALTNPPQLFDSPAPAPMMGPPFSMPMQSGPPEAGEGGGLVRHEVAKQKEKQKPKAKEPGMLTVSSSDDSESSKLKHDTSDFEELISKNQHNNVLRVNVQSKPKNDSVTFLKEKFANDMSSLRSAIKEVLDNSMMAGNITSDQVKAITEQLTGALLTKDNISTNGTVKNETLSLKKVEEQLKTMRNNVAKIEKGCADTIDGCKRFKDAGICPFVSAFMSGACAKTCDTCATHVKTRIEAQLETRQEENIDFRDANGPVMYLDFDNVTNNNIVVDRSGHSNNGVLLKGARISGRKLGTCGKGAEVNGGDISWEGKSFVGKPVDAVTLAMWVKVRKGGIINWFASGDKGTTFYTSANEAIIPSKIWTHVAGTYDSSTGLSRIYIDGALRKETQQKKGQKLVQDWLVNGVGGSFGDDSMHYVDEVYIFNRALKEAEVKAIHNKCAFNRMVIHYGFQKGNNSLINDQSGLENDAIPVGGAIQKDDCDRCGACMDMTHGLNPTVKIERISLNHIPSKSVSIAVWVSMNTTKGIHDVFITQGPLDGSGYRLRIVDGRIRWSVGTDNGETIFDHETASVVVPETLWTHIIATYSKETGGVSIFANGVSKLTETVEFGHRKLLPKDWETEAKLGDKSFNGFMDEFIMYNWAIDSSEATYVRNYCADHPKLVRFTVRVPLTKRNKVLGRYKKLSLGSSKKLTDIIKNA